VDPRAGLDDVEKRKFLTLPGLELRPLGRPARSQSLYRLCYLGSSPNSGKIQFIKEQNVRSSPRLLRRDYRLVYYIRPSMHVYAGLGTQHPRSFSEMLRSVIW
jgi:hypothetical protein